MVLRFRPQLLFACAATLGCSHEPTGTSEIATRARFVPELQSAARAITNPLPAWTLDDAASHNFISDGKGEYVAGTCGMTGSIFYSNYDAATGSGGDATFDNSNPSRSCPRQASVILDGVSRNVWFFNVRSVLAIPVGESRNEDFVIDITGDATCTRIGWKAASDGGAGGQMLVTRTSSTTWTGQTSGGARCMYFQGQTRVWTRNVDVQVSLALRQQ